MSLRILWTRDSFSSMVPLKLAAGERSRMEKNNVKVKILHSRDTKFDVIVNFDDTLEQWFLPLTPSSRDMLGLSPLVRE